MAPVHRSEIERLHIWRDTVAAVPINASYPIAPACFPQAIPCKAGFPRPGGRLGPVVARPPLGYTHDRALSHYYPRMPVNEKQNVVDHSILLSSDSEDDEDEAVNDGYDCEDNFGFYSREVNAMDAREGCAMVTERKTENHPPCENMTGKEKQKSSVVAWEKAAPPTPPVDVVQTFDGVSIGLCGGMGPMAGCMLHQIVIANTIATGDRDHVDVIHLSNAARVPDRTAFLQGKIEQNPGAIVALVAKHIGDCAAQSSNKVVCGVPCNTFHSPQIWEEFVRLLDDQPNVEVVHMLEETAKHVQELCPGAKKIGLMSTTGTRSTGVYNSVLEPRGFTIVEVPMDQQDELHDAIYNPEWGIKAVSPVSSQARGKFVTWVKMLVEQGAEAVILGCTEIPLALPEKAIRGVPLVNPMVALGRALVGAAAPKKLKPLP